MLLGIGLLGGFLQYVGPYEILAVIRGVPPLILVSMLALNILSLFMYSLAWYILIRISGHRVPIGACQAISLSAIFTYYVTPSGLFLEATRVLLASKESKTKMRLGEGAATVVMHKILFTIGFVGCTVLSVAMLLLRNPAAGSSLTRVYALVGVTVAGLIAFTYLSSNITRLKGISKRAITKLEPTIRRLSRSYRLGTMQDSADAMLKQFDTAFSRMTQNRIGLLASFCVILGYWLSTVFIMYLVFRALNYEISIWVVVLTIAVGDFIQMTPILIPGMLGIFETVLTAVLTSFRVPLTLAASATVLARLTTFWINIPITGAAAAYYGTKYVVRNVVRAAIDAASVGNRK